MSIINRFLTVVTEPEFKLARDLTAMAIADGALTPEEKEAISAICLFQIIAGRQARATETFCQNEILMKGFKRAGLDLARILKEEEMRAFMKYTV